MTKAGRGIRQLRFRHVLFSLCAVTVAVSCGPPPHEGAARHLIEMDAFSFRPDTVRVVAGDTVVWTNRDVVPHTATAGAWDSGPIAPGSSWEMATVEGDTIGYVCKLHPAMTATLIIEDRRNAPSRAVATGG